MFLNKDLSKNLLTTKTIKRFLDFREVDQNSESATDQPSVIWPANLIADALGHLSHKMILKKTKQVAFWKLS